MDSLTGWLGGLLLAICGLPQAIASWREGHSQGLDPIFLWCWFIGEVLLLWHVLSLYGLNWLAAPLLVNYAFNVVLLAIIIKFKYWERPCNP